MVDDYARVAAWRFGQELDKVGGPGRLAQMVVNDWANKDRARRKTGGFRTEGGRRQSDQRT
jgi:hypothetical protein